MVFTEAWELWALRRKGHITSPGYHKPVALWLLLLDLAKSGVLGCLSSQILKQY